MIRQAARPKSKEGCRLRDNPPGEMRARAPACGPARGRGQFGQPALTVSLGLRPSATQASTVPYMSARAGRVARSFSARSV